MKARKRAVQYLKSKINDDGQEQRKKGKVRIKINVNSTLDDDLTESFDKTYDKFKHVIQTISHGAHLVLVREGKKKEEIEFTKNDFEHNDDNDTSSSYSNSESNDSDN